jgi:bifunctional non-homologous end joining protein LigD
VHEIKHDGYRLIVRRAGDRVRLLTRRGIDWTKRFPRILDAVRRLRVSSIVIDGEACVCDNDGISDFEKLHSQGYDHWAILYAFDLLELDGTDHRADPLEARKLKLEKILAPSSDGVCFNEHLELSGAIVFEHACKLGLEGIVSKRRDMPYRSGRAKCWLKTQRRW